MDEVVGRFLKLWEGDSSTIVSPDEEPRLNSAVVRWVESGKTIDTLLDLDRIDGDTYYTLASVITSWIVSTPEGRLRSYIWDKASEDEEKLLKQDPNAVTHTSVEDSIVLTASTKELQAFVLKVR